MHTDGPPPTVADRPITRSSAEEIGAFRLAEQWPDRLSWPRPGDRTARDELAELAELAHMSALAAWLRRWRPIHIHGALLGGAQAEDVATALGGSLDEIFRLWHEWASGQRYLFIAGNPGITNEESERVAGIFVAVGLTMSDSH